jgi:hypothetical protein
MKRRSGFVSNSSSSSFIVAVKRDTDVCKHCGRGGEDLLKTIEAMLSGCESEIDRRGSDDVIKYIKDGWFDEKESEKIVKSIEEKASEGYEVVSISVDYNDESAFNYIETNKDVVVLNRWD